VLVKVTEFVVVEVYDVENPMRSCRSTIVNWHKHILWVYNDLIEEGIVITQVSIFPVPVGFFEEGEDLCL